MHSKLYIFLGYKTDISRDVYFDENTFPFATSTSLPSSTTTVSPTGPLHDFHNPILSEPSSNSWPSSPHTISPFPLNTSHPSISQNLTSLLGPTSQIHQNTSARPDTLLHTPKTSSLHPESSSPSTNPNTSHSQLPMPLPSSSALTSRSNSSPNPSHRTFIAQPDPLSNHSVPQSSSVLTPRNTHPMLTRAKSNTHCPLVRSDSTILWPTPKPSSHLTESTSILEEPHTYTEASKFAA